MRTPFCLLLAATLALPAAAKDAVDSVVPRPRTAVPLDLPAWGLNDRTGVFFAGGEAAGQEARFLAGQLRLPTGLPLPVAPERGVGANAILLSLLPELKKELGEEGYRLDIGAGARITAATPAGLFYGGQTLRQLLPAGAFAKARQAGAPWPLPCCRIEDAPRHPWRGFMLDYARHFFSVAYTKHLLDEMAARKMNVFHMHLTDDDGWRVEIKKYPKLTQVGAWRGSKCALPSLRKGESVERYGGFFTQEDIKEIVAYAAARHIQVLPEIDLPGHALALVTAYPEALPTVLSSARNDNGFGNNLLSPAKEANYQMVDDILAEVAQLFPFEYVHIGGDEVDHWFWDNCPQIQQLIAREKLAGTQDLQGYFTRRVEALLAKHGKKMVGWNEIMDGRLSRKSVIMSWTGRAAAGEALRGGFSLVAAHSPDLSPDMLYPHPGDEPPVPGFAGPVSFQRGLEFDPSSPEELAAARAPHGSAARIRGVEGCLWAEYVAPWQSTTGWLNLKTAEETADFKIFPRLCALADTGWGTPAAPAPQAQTGPLFGRLAADLARLRAGGITYRSPAPDVVRRKGALIITPPCAGAVVRYTLDGTDPLTSPSALAWDGAPVRADAARFVARAFIGGVPGPLCFGARSPVVAQWDPHLASESWRTREIDLTGHLDEPGLWRLRFRRLNGRHALQVGHVDVTVNGKLVAQGEGAHCRLEVETAILPGDKVAARIDCRVPAGGDEPDTFGYILLEQAEGLAPGVRVATSIPAVSGEYAVENLEGFDPRAYFWSARAAKKGETLVFTFDEPEDLTQVECLTGVPGSLPRDRLADGVLEISADGETFREAAAFKDGAAKANFPRQAVKAVRITVTADQAKAWLAVQGLIVK